MIAAKRRVALVAPGGDPRTALAGYLTAAGFAVDERDAVASPRTFDALVVISAHDITGEALAAELRAWIRRTTTQRVVVVTSKPTHLKELAATVGDRLRVLAAPAFGWEVVDALRADPAGGPRGG